MNAKKITKDSILEAIKNTAEIMIKKYELYESVKELNKELKLIYESAPMVGSFGFKSPEESVEEKNFTGFEKNPNISFIAQLEKEMGKENGDNSLNEMDNLKFENEQLKKELDELKSKK